MPGQVALIRAKGRVGGEGQGGRDGWAGAAGRWSAQGWEGCPVAKPKWRGWSSGEDAACCACS